MNNSMNPEDRYYARCEQGNCQKWCSKSITKFSEKRYGLVLCWLHQKQEDMKLMAEKTGICPRCGERMRSADTSNGQEVGRCSKDGYTLSL